MKNLRKLSLLLLLITCSAPVAQDNASIRFNEQEYDFGSLSYKKGVEYRFEFSNPGETPLVIYDVKTSCGCTVPDWTKKPVKSSESGKVTVIYDSAFPGVFHKEISVFYNGPDSPARLDIKGRVEYPDDVKAD